MTSAISEESAREHDRRSCSPEQIGKDETASDSKESDRNLGHNIYVAGLSTRTEEADLEELFHPFGEIARCQIMRDPQTQSHRGFAFVTMVNAEAAEKAIEKLHGIELHNRRIRVELGKRARPRTPTPGKYLGPPKRHSASYDGRRRRSYNNRRGTSPSSSSRFYGRDRASYHRPSRTSRSRSRSRSRERHYRQRHSSRHRSRSPSYRSRY
ncbi:hypothetical protein BDF22DRAFT_693700 [Syncephalis plumigaleata]|nr:hypothetical protein BDF22DRAFT_693700 [Syncephalis plumigaleata]